jgi:protein TonB
MAVVVSVQRRYDPTPWLAAALLISLLAHATFVYTRSGKIPSLGENKPIEMEVVELPPPPPPPPEPEKPPEPPKVKPPPVKIIKVAEVKPPPEEPPRPTEEAPKEDVKPVVIGISMDSTVGASNFAAPVGNTTLGAVGKTAVDPNSVGAYKAEHYVPPGGADTDPVLENEPKIPYPEEAKRAQIEGTVRLRVTVDNTGRVVDVKVLNKLGYGLDEAAREAIKHMKFKPATKGGEAVSTTITYNYTFLLD